MEKKFVVEEKARELIQLTAGFCKQYLDDEYEHLCEKLIRKMARKRAVPFLSGRLDIWAAAIVHALGTINFLFDRSSQPYATVDDISGYFGTSKSTVSQKSKAIRDMFNLFYWDKEFSAAAVKEHDPHKDMIMYNGFIMPISMLPPELQEVARRMKNAKR